MNKKETRKASLAFLTMVVTLGTTQAQVLIKNGELKNKNNFSITLEACLTTFKGSLLSVKDVPNDLQPPHGYVLSLKVFAAGDQVYACTGKEWKLHHPDAMLYCGDNALAPVVGHHSIANDLNYVRGDYDLSRHPKGPWGDNFGPKPAWRFKNKDGSMSLFIAKSKKEVAQKGTIPWLGIQGVFSNPQAAKELKAHKKFADFVQRLNTTGGLPGGPCSNTNKDAIFRAPYTANYYFYSGPPAVAAAGQ